jgi:hypothetical protein
MIVTEKDREIRNWINKNKDKHKWVTHTMLDLYAKHYHQEQVEKLNIDDVSKCQHPYKKVISGDDGMYCTECNKYITTF